MSRKRSNKRENKHEARVNRGNQQLKEDFDKRQFSNDWDLNWFSPRGLQLDCVDSFDRNTFTIVNGPSGCVDADTEFLSQGGWKRIADYTEGDKVMQCDSEVQGSFVTPLRYIKEPCEEMFHFKTDRGIDQMLCENHSIAKWQRRSKKLSKVTVNRVLKSYEENKRGYDCKVPKFYDYKEGFKLGLSEDEIKLAVALKADGHLTSESTGRYVLRFKKQRKIDRLHDLLSKLNYEYKYHVENSSGFSVFKLYANWCSKSYYDWFGCSKEDAKIILDEFKYWDGYLSEKSNRLVKYSCTVKEDADAFQYFANICGYKADITIQDRVGQKYKDNDYIRKSVEYSVQITEQRLNMLLPPNGNNGKSKLPEKVKTKDGFKYCFTVPDGFLVLRRNGKVFVTGNCGKTSVALWLALHALKNRDVSQLIFIKNPVECSDDLIGYLSGSEQDKLSAHFDSTKRIFHTLMSKNKLDCDISKDKIRLTIPNFLLGSTFSNAAVIIDEAQTMSPPIIKMLLERCGENTKYIVMGDPTQRYAAKRRVDGFSDLIEKVTVPIPHTTDARTSKYPNSFGYIKMTRHDNQRSEGSKLINLIYEENE